MMRGNQVTRTDSSTPALHASIVGDPEELEDIVGQWDQLAVDNRAPYSAPAWCLAWWRHVAPPSAQLRVIVVRDDETVVAVAPFYCVAPRLRPVRYGFLAGGTSPRVEPLARPGTEDAAAAAIVAALTTARPRPDVIEFAGTPVESPWPALLGRKWPGTPPKVLTTQSMSAPAVRLDADFERWLAGRSRNFRQQARRHRRRLLDSGATFRVVSDAADARDRLDDFERLHEARWRYRGGSGVLDRRVMNMLHDVAVSMTASGRFRLHVIEHSERVISAHVFVAAGREVTYWLGGFDEEWSAEQPSLQALVAAIEHAIAVGDDRFDLGPGAQPYKLRLSDHEQELQWLALYPPGPRRPLVIASTLPHRIVTSVRQAVFDVLTTERKNQIKRWLRRFRG